MKLALSRSGRGARLGIFLSALAAFFVIGFIEPLGASELLIRNDSQSGIINILVQPATSEKAPFFFRLDLFPGGKDQVENPEISASLRADTGLQLWSYPQMDLGAMAALVFCAEHPACLLQKFRDGATRHLQGIIQELVPQKGSRPVCNLDRFRPAMPMKEVCAILPDHALTDDNGAILTGLGFAHMVWAARMIPEQSGPVGHDSLLEHLELRIPLTREHVDNLLTQLLEQGFLPWQAEFPGLDMEFDETSQKDRPNQQEKLRQQILSFMKSHSPIAHRDHDVGEKCDQASILMAPGNIIPALQNSDEPLMDVQIFTIYLRPCTDTLLLDVTAYRSQGQTGK